MKTFTRCLILTLTAALLWSFTQTAKASHFRFANLSWKRAPGANPLAVEITVTEAWRISSGGIGEIFYQLGDGSGNFSTSTATRIATLTDAAGEQYEVWRYSTSHTYPSNGLFTVSGTSCCRISSLVNAAGNSESLSMVVDLRSPSNTGSPVTTAPVILQMQAGTNNSIALPIVDPDGDAFTVRVATSAESSIFTLPTVTNAVSTNVISVTSGGVLNWNTVGGTNGQKFALQVIVEERRAGNTTGTNGHVPLDFIIELAGSLTNLTPTVTGTNGAITVLANRTFTTTFVGTDPEGGPLHINHQGLPPGATITPAGGTTNASPASVTFSWTPTLADVGSSYAVLIFFTDQGGLQRAASFALTVSAAAAGRDFELLSINALDTASGNGASLNPVVSSNGQYVAFVSDAANLVASDNNGERDVFWRDRVSGTTRLVSRTATGASGNADSDAPAISADGRYVAFHSRASNLVATDKNADYDVFVWDAQDNSVTLVSRTSTGGSGAGASFSPRLSANGRVVSFASTAADLVPNDTNSTADAFARDLDLGVTYIASRNTNGFSGNGASGVPVLSANGTHVAFLSRAGDLVTNDFNGFNDIFVHNLQTRVTTLVSVNVAGTDSGNRLSSDPAISADGRYVAFASQATNLVILSDTNNFPDVFVRDMQALSGLGQTKLVSVNGSGTASGGNTGNPSILPASFTPFLSADGTKVLFVSLAQDLVANDSNGKQDVFLRDHINNTTTLISTNRFGTGSGNAASGVGANCMSADLRYVAFFSQASNVGTADTNNRTDVFLRDLATNATKVISRVNLGGFAANGHSFQPVISADGSTILFTSEADNLDNRDANAQSDVFAAATALGAPNFGVVDVGVSLSTVSARTVDNPFTLTITVTNHSASPATGLVLGNSGAEFLQFISRTVSQGTLTTDNWVVGDLAANGSATATVTLVATNLGEGNVIVSITQRDQLDFNLNNNAALSTVTANQTAAGALFYLPGNTAYLSRTNSPFFAGILSGAFTLEDFERGVFSLAGVTASAGRVAESGTFTDSVDADDGVVDGAGNGGHSYLVTETNSVTFTFNAAVLGRLPTKVGVVISDTFTANTRMEAFDTNGVSLGVLGPLQIGDNLFTGGTAEDRFIGVEFAGGISAVRVFYPQPDFELDHLQFNLPTTDLQLTGTAPASAVVGTPFTVTLSVTNLGPAVVTSTVVTNADPGPIQLTSAVASQGAFDGMTGTWTVGGLAVGAGATLTLTGSATNVGQIQFYSRVLSEVPERNTANDGVTQTVLVPNQPPALTFQTNNVVVLEDAGLQTRAGFGMFSGPEPGQMMSANLSNNNPALFSVQPAAPNGTLTFTPAANANGSATVKVIVQDSGGTANGGVDRTTNTFLITVLAVNDAPTLTFTTNNLVVFEDTAAQTLPDFVAASAGPVDERVVQEQSVTNYTVTSSVPGMFAVAPALALNGTLTFTLAANSNGSTTITVVAQDDGGTADGGVNQTTSTFTITVTPVNDAPSFAFASNIIVVLEDAGPVTLANQIASTATGPMSESAQAITNYVVTTTNTAFFTVQPALDVAGTLTFTLAPDVNGTAYLQVQAQDDGGTANGGTNGSALGLLTLAVTSVNDTPTIAFTTNNQVVLEDVAAQTFAAFAIFAPVEAGQAITNITTTNSSPGMFATQPFFTVDGTLRFTPAANANGAATVTVIAQDDGGTANGGVDRTTNSFTITVTAVNDAPTLTLAISSLGVSEDIGLTTYASLVASFSPGPADEAAQTRIGSYVVTNSNPALFDIQPSVDVNGTLTFQGATNATGTITVGVTAQDSGGAANGGVDTGTALLTLFLQQQNDPPSFTFATNNVVVLEDSGAATVTGFIATSSVGPVQETGLQAITNYFVTAATTSLFAVQPAIGTNGTLTFTPAVNAFGVTTVSVVARDNGGNGNGGDSNSTPQTFTLTITAVNDAPSFTFTNFPARDGVRDWVRDATANSSSGVKIITDDSGNVIVAGDEANGASEVTTYLVHVVKYSNAGVAQWTNIISGNGLGASVRTRGLAVDSTGAVILSGLHSGGGNDFLTMKFSAAGSLVWSNRFDALGDDEPMAVVVDGNNKIIVTGKSQDGFYTDYLTIKYLADGTPFWTNRSSYSSVGNDVARSVAVDAAGDVYVTGDGAEQKTYAYTLKLAAATGVPVWTNRFDIDGQDSTAEAVRVDSGGNVIVAGTLNDAGGQTSFGVVKYSSVGAVVWTNLYTRNTAAQHVHGLAVDSAGNVFITGNTEVARDMDFTTLKYLADGTPAWTNHYNGAALGRDHPNAIAVNAAGEVIVTGDSAGALSTDWVTVKYTAAGAGVWTNRYDGTSSGNDTPNAVAVDAGTNVFVTGVADGVMRTIKYAFVPSPGANQTVTESGSGAFPGFIVSFSAGPANEAAQTISFTVTNDNMTFFSAQPIINPAGLLSYTVVSGVTGLVTVTVHAVDNGGTANGGVDTSAAQTFTLSVKTAGLSLAAIPPLAPRVDGGDRVVRWPAGVVGFELQTAPAIAGPWTAVMAPVAQENGDSVVRLPAGGTRFYRLVRPGAPRPNNNPTQ